MKPNIEFASRKINEQAGWVSSTKNGVLCLIDDESYDLWDFFFEVNPAFDVGPDNDFIWRNIDENHANSSI